MSKAQRSLRGPDKGPAGTWRAVCLVAAHHRDMASQTVVDLWEITGALVLSLVVSVAAAVVDSFSATKAHPVHTGHLIVVAVIAFAATLAVLFLVSWLVIAPVRDRVHTRNEVRRLSTGTRDESATTLPERCESFADELDKVWSRAALDLPALSNPVPGTLAGAQVGSAANKLYLDEFRMRGLALMRELVDAGLATPDVRRRLADLDMPEPAAAVFREIATAGTAELPLAISQRVVAQQLRLGNAILAAWPKRAVGMMIDQRVWVDTPESRAADEAQAPEATAWESETYRLLGEHAPNWAERFHLEVNLGPEWFAEYQGELAERSMLRRRLLRLAEIQAELNGSAG